MNRIDLYLHRDMPEYYTNTKQEQILLNKFISLYTQAKSVHEQHFEVNPKNLEMWRKAYLGTLNALDITTGEESKRKSRQLRKLVYEIVESKVDNSIPLPKMKARYKDDTYLIEKTENYIKFECDTILSRFDNDKSERSTYIDGTSWYKVTWDSLDNSYERSGDVKIELRMADEIIPQPGITDYKKLEYIFEIQEVSTSRLYDLYGRLIMPTSSNTNVVKVISCYYLNENRIVGLFSWAEASQQVICNEKDWQIRKVRRCTRCGAIVPQSNICPNCGSTNFRYKNADKEILDTTLMEFDNPYDPDKGGDTEQSQPKVFLEKGSEIPFYQIRQLPFVPRPAVSSLDSIYGISEVFIELDMQDAINKIWTKSVEKVLKSGTVLTKPKNIKMSDTDETFKVLGVNSAEEAAMVQSKQVLSDITQEVVMARDIYDSAKSSSGITDAFQGKSDYTATSGKAKQANIAQTAGRIESLRVMKATAFAGVYELVLKYLLAFSDEERRYVRTLPNGKTVEETWNKYMFLSKNKYGEIYYRDDFEFETDPASTLSQNRVQMWQEIQDKFINGALGNPQDPKVVELYWTMLSQLQYPLANVALAGIKDMTQHLPSTVEEAILKDPELQQMIMSKLEENVDNRGGARENSGPAGNGATHAANVERTNERNRSKNREQLVSAQGGGNAIN